jgi:hypothetical protein
MVLFLNSKERDNTGAWTFWVTPNPQIPGVRVTRHPDSTWTCRCGGSIPGQAWSPVVASTIKPCDHIHFAYMHYVEVMAKTSQMKSKVAEVAQRVRSLKAVQDNIKLSVPDTTFINEQKRKIKLED